MLSIFCFPDGVERERRMSGMPESSAVKAMLPLANAERGRPDGAIVMCRVSTMSTYMRGERCLTFARRHGRAGVLALPMEEIAGMVVDEGALEFLYVELVEMFRNIKCIRQSHTQPALCHPAACPRSHQPQRGLSTHCPLLSR